MVGKLCKNRHMHQPISTQREIEQNPVSTYVDRYNNVIVTSGHIRFFYYWPIGGAQCRTKVREERVRDSTSSSRLCPTYSHRTSLYGRATQSATSDDTLIMGFCVLVDASVTL